MSRSTVLITGCSSGIGLLSAKSLAEAGHHVIAVVRSETAANRLTDWANARRVHIDCHRQELTELDANAFIASLDPIDVLINNAGIAQASAVEETSLEAYRRLLEVNFIAPMALTQAVLPGMRERHRGSIVMVSSLSAVAGLAGDGAYAASKAALLRCSESLQFEVAPIGIRVCNLILGAYATQMPGKLRGSVPTAAHSPYADLHARLSTPHEQGADPAEVAKTIVDLIGQADPPFWIPVGKQAGAVLAQLQGHSGEQRMKYLMQIQK